MRIILIKGQQFDYDIASDVRNQSVQTLLSGCYRRDDLRPKCLCTGKPLSLQVKRINGHFYLAKMKYEGLLHSFNCPHHGQTKHGDSKDTSSHLQLNFSLQINQHDKPAGDTNLAGLLNSIWSKAGLSTWYFKSSPRGWKYVAQRIYSSLQGLKINGIPTPRLLWVMPHMDSSQVIAVRDECLGFVQSCNQNNHYAILIAPIGYSEYQNHSMCLRFRTIDKPPVFIDYKKFPIKTFALKDKGESPYPVAIMLVRCPNDKPYLQAVDMAMLWMSSNYLPAATKARSTQLNEALQNYEYIDIPLDQIKGKLLPQVAKVRKGAISSIIDSTETPIQLPWIQNA